MLLGTEIELFLRDEYDNAIPAHNLFPPKEDAIALTGNSIVYRDGFAVEINFLHGESCRETLVWNISHALEALDKQLPRNYHISFSPTAVFNIRPEYPDDVLFTGCQPSRNAYTGISTRVNIPSGEKLRHIGGHLHCSFPIKEAPSWIKNATLVDKCVRLLDARIAAPLAFLTNLYYTASHERRKYYGRAGDYRIQTYPINSSNPTYIGIEYRVPSAFDVFSHPVLFSFATGVMRRTMHDFTESVFDSEWTPKLEREIPNFINSNSTINPIFLPTIGYIETASELTQAYSLLNLLGLRRNNWAGWDSCVGWAYIKRILK